MSYEPSQEIIERYAGVLVDFALGDGEGIKPGDTVRVIGSEETKPLFAEVCRAVWRSGGNVIQALRMAQDESLQPRARLLRTGRLTHSSTTSGEVLPRADRRRSTSRSTSTAPTTRRR